MECGMLVEKMPLTDIFLIFCQKDEEFTKQGFHI